MNSKQDSDPNLVSQFINQYHDCGRMKWLGFYLSDHTASLQKVDRKAQLKIDRQHTDKMDLQEIVKIINISIIKKVPVKIERNLKDKDGYLAPFIEGVIIGFYQDKLVIGQEYISIDEIYAISFIS